MQKVTMQIESLKLIQLAEIIINLYNIIMTEIDPLQLPPIIHNGWYNFRKGSNMPYPVIAEHKCTTDELDINGFFLLLLNLLFGLGGDVPHG